MTWHAVRVDVFDGGIERIELMGRVCEHRVDLVEAIKAQARDIVDEARNDHGDDYTAMKRFRAKRKVMVIGGFDRGDGREFMFDYWLPRDASDHGGCGWIVNEVKEQQ
jgi:hypothetical protein